MHHTISQIFQRALVSGWKIVNCSCFCGGKYAWIEPSGRMHGCVCHSSLPDIDNTIPEFIEEYEVEL